MSKTRTVEVTFKMETDLPLKQLKHVITTKLTPHGKVYQPDVRSVDAPNSNESRGITMPRPLQWSTGLV